MPLNHACPVATVFKAKVFSIHILKPVYAYANIYFTFYIIIIIIPRIMLKFGGFVSFIYKTFNCKSSKVGEYFTSYILIGIHLKV